MRVELKLFAIARQKAGRPSVEVDLPEGSTIADLKRALADSHPALSPILPNLMFAMNDDYARDDARISPGAELAAIPPVSGGGPGAWIEITESPIDTAAVLDRVRSNLAGAVCLFLGTVREITGEKRTTYLEYEAYPRMAQAKLAELASKARERWPWIQAAIVHRVGHLELGDVAVAVAVSCPHRAESFEACRWLMDTIKEVVPIWKKETWADGSEEWVHPGLDAESPSQ